MVSLSGWSDLCRMWETWRGKWLKWYKWQNQDLSLFYLRINWSLEGWREIHPCLWHSHLHGASAAFVWSPKSDPVSRPNDLRLLNTLDSLREAGVSNALMLGRGDLPATQKHLRRRKENERERTQGKQGWDSLRIQGPGSWVPWGKSWRNVDSVLQDTRFETCRCSSNPRSPALESCLLLL